MNVVDKRSSPSSVVAGCLLASQRTAPPPVTRTSL
jgi:hypothetical protein